MRGPIVRPLTYAEANGILLENRGTGVAVTIGARIGNPPMAIRFNGRILKAARLRAGAPDEELVLMMGRDPNAFLFLERKCFGGAMVREFETGARKLSVMLGSLEVAIMLGAEA